MRRKGWTGTTASKSTFRRAAVLSVSTATLFALVGAGAGAAAVPTHATLTVSAFLPSTDPPGACNPEEIGQRKIGRDGRPYVCMPLGSAGKFGIEDAQRLAELASDPARSGKITAGSLREAMAALGLEKAGQLPARVRRHPTGAVDFVDGAGVSWNAHDVDLSPQSRHNLRASVFEVGIDLLSGHNVILITDDLSAKDTSELRAAIDSAGLSNHVLLWPGTRSNLI